MRILYNYASRSRNKKFFDGLDNIISMAKQDDYIILCVLDIDDPAMANKDTFERIKSYGDKIIPMYGYSSGKIDAINRSINHLDGWHILVNFSDDMKIIREGFDLEIIRAMETYFPDTDGVLHFADGHKYKDALMTMTICGKAYYDRDKYVYHPSYKSLWCDNESKDVALIRGKYKYMSDEPVWFNHIHPLHSKGVQMDEQYRHTESFYKQDQANYYRRKALNFPA